MRTLTLWLAIATVASCGPSAGSIKAAEDTRYKADPATLFAGAKAATASDYKLVSSDDAAFTLTTEGVWYTPEGQVDRAPGQNIARLQDMSINFAVVVKVVKADADTYKVAVEPIALRKEGLVSKPVKLEMTDPSVPGWVHGKVETLDLAIHDRLKSYAVTGATVPAVVPSGTPSPAAGSGAGSAAGSNAGSAAPEPAPGTPPPP
jgi:hypothetical protein